MSLSKREQSKAQQSTVVSPSPLPKAAYNNVRADQIMHQTKYVRIGTLRPVCFPGRMELLAFASRLFAPKMLDHLPRTYYICLSFHSIHPSEGA